MVKGFIPVSIREELMELVDLLIEAGDIEFKERASVIQEALKEFLTKRGYHPGPPRFEHIHIDPGRVVIKERNVPGYITITRNEKALFCKPCGSEDCEHIKFIKFIPEIRQAIKQRSKSGKAKKA